MQARSLETGCEYTVLLKGLWAEALKLLVMLLYLRGCVKHGLAAHCTRSCAPGGESWGVPSSVTCKVLVGLPRPWAG
jgi:hypothetical protein